jgi:hypothetical protein
VSLGNYIVGERTQKLSVHCCSGVEQWSSTWGKRTPGNKRRHLRGHVEMGKKKKKIYIYIYIYIF